MATRSGLKITPMKERAEAFYKPLSRAYLYWFVAVLIGVLGLKASSIGVAGVKLDIDRPELLEGMFYLAALVKVSGIWMDVFFNNPYRFRDSSRTAIWIALPRGTKSLRGATRESLVDVKRKARLMGNFFSAIPLVFSLPIILAVALFNPLKTLGAIGAFLGIY